MLTNEPVKILAVRLPEGQRRRIKSLAASLGMSLQEVVHRALEAWAAEHDPQGTRAASTRPQPGAETGKPQPRRRK